MGGMDNGTLQVEAGMSAQLFESLRDGYEAALGYKELAQRVAAAEVGLTTSLDNGALGDLDAVLTADDLDIQDNLDLAGTSLHIAIEKTRLLRQKDTQQTRQRSQIDNFFGREVRIVPIDPTGTHPITRYYFSGGLAGTRRYEKCDFYRQRAHGVISDIDNTNAKLWVTSKVGTGRIAQFFADPYKWRIDMFDTDTGAPLVNVEFVD